MDYHVIKPGTEYKSVLFILACLCFLSGKTKTKSKTELVVAHGFGPLVLLP